MNRAIVNKNTWSNSNTQVIYNDNTDCSEIYLHGHKIAVYDHNTNSVKLNSFGYKTVTTKSRLNAILDEVKYGARVFHFSWSALNCIHCDASVNKYDWRLAGAN